MSHTSLSTPVRITSFSARAVLSWYCMAMRDFCVEVSIRSFTMSNTTWRDR